MRAAAAATLLAAIAASATARAAEPDAYADLRPLIGGWSGRMTCKTSGVYSIGMAIEEDGGRIVARYSTIMLATSLKAGGEAAVTPAGAPGSFTAGADNASIRVKTAEKGKVLLFSPNPAATGTLALVKFSGTARLDKARAKAAVRYTVATPLGSDPCSGSMAKQKVAAGS